MTVRVREYVVGKALYALLVTSPPDRDLQAATSTWAHSRSTGGAAKNAAASASAPARARRPAARPAGSAAENTLAGWGVATDPDGDCTFEPKGNTLVVEVPNTDHGLVANLIDRSKCARVLREVEGDFEIQVKVDGTFKPTGPGTTLLNMPTNEGRPARHQRRR